MPRSTSIVVESTYDLAILRIFFSYSSSIRKFRMIVNSRPHVRRLQMHSQDGFSGDKNMRLVAYCQH